MDHSVIITPRNVILINSAHIFAPEDVRCDYITVRSFSQTLSYCASDTGSCSPLDS